MDDFIKLFRTIFAIRMNSRIQKYVTRLTPCFRKKPELLRKMQLQTHLREVYVGSINNDKCPRLYPNSVRNYFNFINLFFQ